MVEDTHTSQPPSPTDELRRAAALMRERAEAATNFAWSVSAPGEVWRHYDGQVRAVDFPDGFDDSIADVYDNDDAQHIASWHPAVALAVADWLDKIASEGHEGDGPNGCADCDPSLTVARAYLGESA